MPAQWIQVDSSPGAGLDLRLEQVPDCPAVFLVWPREGAPYLARTSHLRRRLKRLLGQRAAPSRLLNLREVARRVEYYLTASRLAAQMRMYELARLHFPRDYRTRLRLRFPSYVKLLPANGFPRTQVSTRLSGSKVKQVGPFRTRANAERFEQELLDLFQIRRCQEDLRPHPGHPGCIYGEMGRCLRPCQQVVGPEEYQAEVERVAGFLESGGRALLASIGRSRERLIESMEFEAAQRQHRRFEKVEQVLRNLDELAHDIDRLNGVALTASPDPGQVELRFMMRGAWAPAVEFRVAPAGGEMVPLDRRLREVAAALVPPSPTLQERQEHLALLARWFYSSWRDGEWLPFENLTELPYRRLVRALARVAQTGANIGANIGD